MKISPSIPGRVALIDQKEWLFFAGTAYLGIPHHLEFRQLIVEGLNQYGNNFGASRANTPAIDVYQKAESKLADFCKSEAALVVSSGSLAGQLAVIHLETTHHCFFAPDAHPAIVGKGDQKKLTFEDWTEKILNQIHKNPGRYAIFCNAIDPLGVREYNFNFLNDLDERSETTVLLDDSHALGVTGIDGAGSYRPTNFELIVTASMGKAWGVPAGVILGQEKTIKKIASMPLFRGSSPPLPAYLHAFIYSNAIYLESRKRLFENLDQFNTLTSNVKGLQSIPKFPIYKYLIEGFDQFAMEAETIISSFHYPSETDPKLVRIIINALHTSEDVKKLADLITSFEKIK